MLSSMFGIVQVLVAYMLMVECCTCSLYYCYYCSSMIVVVVVVGKLLFGMVVDYNFGNSLVVVDYNNLGYSKVAAVGTVVVCMVSGTYLLTVVVDNGKLVAVVVVDGQLVVDYNYKYL